MLDTNVLLHDPMSLYRFEEHDIYLPMITLEELDGQQEGYMTEVALQCAARSANWTHWPPMRQHRQLDPMTQA